MIRYYSILLILVQVLSLEIFLIFWLFCEITFCVKISLTSYEFFCVNSSYEKTFQKIEFLDQSVFIWSLQGHYFKEKAFQFCAFLELTFQKMIFQQKTIQAQAYSRQNFLEDVEQTLLQKSFLRQTFIEQVFKELIFKQKLRSFLNQNFRELTFLETLFSLPPEQEFFTTNQYSEQER